MTKDELSSQLRKSVFEDFDTYEAQIQEKIQHLLSLINPETEEQASKIAQSLMDYTFFITDTNCDSMVKFLSSLDIPSISPSAE